jgi:hypothetical protein
MTGGRGERRGFLKNQKLMSRFYKQLLFIFLDVDILAVGRETKTPPCGGIVV